MVFNKLQRKVRATALQRKSNNELFINIFEGKIAEFAVYQLFYKHHFDVEYPNMTRMPRGEWDEYNVKVILRGGSDVSAGEYFIVNIKQTSRYSNLLRFPFHNHDKNGDYRYNKSKAKKAVSIIMCLSK